MITHEFQRDFGDIQIDLNRVEGRAFVDAIIDTEPNRLTPDFRRTLTRHTGGNPLFTVELLRELQAEGDLAQDAEGDWVCTDVAWERLPARVEAVIAERIARLPPLWQETLRIASVEGETFTAEAVARTQGLSAETMIGLLSGPLSVTHRLVVPQGLWRVGGGDRSLSRYRFRHGLFQRYLYDSLDAVTRQRHHREVGIALEALLEDEAESIAPELARHFAAGELPERAAAYLHVAGNRAYLFAATEEAIALFMRGLALLKELPETPARRRQELQLQLALTGPLIAQRGWGAQERAGALERAHELAEQMDAAPELLKALFVLADLSRARGDLIESLALGERMLEIAQPDATSEQMALTHYTLGETQLFRGEIATAREHLLTALSHYDAHLHQDLTSITGPNVGVICMTWLSWAVWLLGYPDEALAWAHKALSLAETLDHPLSLAFTLTVGAAGVHLLRGEPAATALYTARLAELVDEQTVAAMQPWAEVLVGVQEATGGALRAGIARVRRGIAAWAAAGALMGRSFQIMLLVELLYRAGEIEAALEEVEGMLAQIEQTGERLILPEYLRWRGVLLESKGEDPTTVEKVLRCALTTARRQSTKAWALRAAVSLARHLAEQGREDEAHALSAPIYNDFTEGFDTPDLQQARALLSGERAEIEV
jgi:predicted ATPase